MHKQQKKSGQTEASRTPSAPLLKMTTNIIAIKLPKAFYYIVGYKSFDFPSALRIYIGIL